MSEPLIPEEIAAMRDCPLIDIPRSCLIRALDELEQLRASRESLLALADSRGRRLGDVVAERDQLKAEVERLKAESARLVP